MACIALGSNLGAREATLQAALARINALAETQAVAVSRFYETSPVDAPADSPPFINAAATVETGLLPAELMQSLLEIERALGRDRSGAARNAPRPIDLDLLLFADVVIDTAALTVPHPRMHQRSFVLEPLAEIASGAVHPVLHMTVGELLQDLQKRMAAQSVAKGAS